MSALFFLSRIERIMEIKDLFKKREMPADEEKPNAEQYAPPNAEQYAPPYEEQKDITLFRIIRILVDWGAEFDIKGEEAEKIINKLKNPKKKKVVDISR